MSNETNKDNKEKNTSIELVKATNYSLMGEVIDDKYIVIDAIGEGALSIVYLAQCSDSRESVAIKTLKYSNKELIEKFLAGAREFQEVKHPNIVEVLEIIEHDNGQPVVIMKYVEGISIRQLLDNIGKIDDENTLISIVSGICSALEYIHTKSMVHGGLSPNQVLISENEVADDFTVTLTDCGTGFLGSEFSNIGGTSNEVSYFSPEQINNQYVGINTDIYSLGVMSYELVTGKHPFARKKLSALVAGKQEDEPSFIPLTHHSLDLPGLTKLNQLLEQSLEKDPDWRLPSVSQFKKELLDWRDEAILEDFDDFEDEIAAEFDAAFEEEEEEILQEEADLNAFDAQPTAEKISKATSFTTTAKIDSSSSSPNLKAEVKKTMQSQNVRFQAGPSFYSDLYSENRKETAEGVDKIQAEKVATTSDDTQKQEELDQVKQEQIEKQEEVKPKEVASITEEEVKAALTKKGKRRRRRRGSSSTQQNVRTTIRNLIRLRENQGSQEETMAMQFAGKFSSKGPRLSPKATAVRLVVGCLVTAVLTGLVMLNLDSIQAAFLSGSKTIGQLTKKESPQEKEEIKQPEINDKIPVINKSLKVIKAKLKKVDPNAPLQSSSTTRLKLKPIEKQTPLASEYYKNWRHHRHQLPNSKVGNRRRIDYKEFNEDWLK